MNAQTSAIPRVVLLTRDGLSSRVVARALCERFHVSRIIVERPPSRLSMIRRRAARVGWTAALDQAIFQALLQPILMRESAARRAQLLALPELQAPPFSEALTYHVESINDPIVIRMLAELRPDVVVVNGTRIIASSLLESTDAPFLNTHAGITPNYRGVHGGYWALAEQRPDLCGVTVHCVDAGIDTGRVIAQSVIRPDPQDNFTTYPLLQLQAALPLLVDTVASLARGGTSVAPTAGAPSRLYYHPRASDYLRRRWLYGVA